MGAVTVTAPLVVVKTKSDTIRYLYSGDVVGDDVSKESLDHLRSLGFLSDSKVVPDPAPENDSGQPAGNASLDDWQEFARSQGASEEDLADKNRNDLRGQFGK